MINLAARVDINITLNTNIQKLLQRLILEHLYFAADDIIMTQCRQRSFFKKSEFIFMISTLKNPHYSFQPPQSEYLDFAADDIIMTQRHQRAFVKESEFIFMISTLKNPTLAFSTASMIEYVFCCR